MASQPVLTFHNGRLDVPEQLQRAWKLHDGSELRVVSSTLDRIVLEPCSQVAPTVGEVMATWQSLKGILFDRRTPEWEVSAQDLKTRATENLDALSKSGIATTTEISQAEREWEFADDELDFGPLPQR